jgi:large subunit ribosomal protein L25
VSEVRLSAEPRTEFGKGAARRTRRAHKVPAVLYGHGTDPRHLALPGHDLMLALKGGANVLLRLDLDGGAELALAKDVQRDPVKGFLEHVDLVVVKRGEKVTVDVPVTLTGEGAPDVLVDQQLMVLSVEAEATHIPTGFEVPLDGLDVGDHISAGAVRLPEGTTLAGDPEQVVVQGLAAPTAEDVDAELAEAEAELGAGEAGAAAQAEAAAEVGDGVPDGSTGTGDVVPGSEEGSGGPTEVRGDQGSGTDAGPNAGA